jgi:hypothetical protein
MLAMRAEARTINPVRSWQGEHLARGVVLKHARGSA